MAAEEVRRRAEEAKVAMLGEMCRLSLVTDELNEADRTEQAHEMLLDPFVPGTGTKAIHEKHVLHPRVDGEVEDMQEAPNAECMYDLIRNNDESPRRIVTLHPLVLPLLVLVVGAPPCPDLCYAPYFASFATLCVLKCRALLAVRFYMRVFDDACCQFAWVWFVGT